MLSKCDLQEDASELAALKAQVQVIKAKLSRKCKVMQVSSEMPMNNKTCSFCSSKDLSCSFDSLVVECESCTKKVPLQIEPHNVQKLISDSCTKLPKEQVEHFLQIQRSQLVSLERKAKDVLLTIIKETNISNLLPNALSLREKLIELYNAACMKADFSNLDISILPISLYQRIWSNYYAPAYMILVALRTIHSILMARQRICDDFCKKSSVDADLYAKIKNECIIFDAIQSYEIDDLAKLVYNESCSILVERLNFSSLGNFGLKQILQGQFVIQSCMKNSLVMHNTASTVTLQQGTLALNEVWVFGLDGTICNAQTKQYLAVDFNTFHLICSATYIDNAYYQWKVQGSLIINRATSLVLDSKNGKNYVNNPIIAYSRHGHLVCT